MRIFSKSSDFYDVARAYGIDEQLVWQRYQFVGLFDMPLSADERDAPRILHNPHEDRPNVHILRHDREHRHYDPHLNTNRITVWVAGKVYRGIAITCDVYGKVRWQINIWSRAQLDRAVIQHKLDVTHEYRYNLQGYKSLDEYFTPQVATVEQEQFLRENAITVAIIFGGKMQTNCTGLKEVGVSSILDPYQTFQEISMWVSSITPRPEKPIVQLSDYSISTKHGFNKASFRKEKQ